MREFISILLTMSSILQVSTHMAIFMRILRSLHFSVKAALSAMPSLDFRPDIIHCHDWQTGLIPVYIKDSFNDNSFYHGIKTIMTIHNLEVPGYLG